MVGAWCHLPRELLGRAFCESAALASVTPSPPQQQPSLSPDLPLTWHLPQFCLELYNPSCRGQKIKACKTDGDGKVVEGKHESYRISAANAEERDQWIEAIR